MANITIVKTGNSIIVNFGEYSPQFNNIVNRSYDSANIQIIDEYPSHVFLYMSETNEQFRLTSDAAYAGSDYMIVDSIGGAAPTSQNDLFNKISALR